MTFNILFPAIGYRKRIAVTVSAGAITGQTAHNLGSTPIAGRPNPDGINGVNSMASTDVTNVTVTLDAPQLTDIIFNVPLFL